MHSLVVAVAGTIALQIQEKNFLIDYIGELKECRWPQYWIHLQSTHE